MENNYHCGFDTVSCKFGPWGGGYCPVMVQCLSLGLVKTFDDIEKWDKLFKENPEWARKEKEYADSI